PSTLPDAEHRKAASWKVFWQRAPQGVPHRCGSCGTTSHDPGHGFPNGHRKALRAMLAGSATSIPSVVTSMMLAVSASQLLYCCANSTDGVPVGIVLATKAAWAVAPD